MSTKLIELREVCGDELRTVEGGFFTGLFATIRSAIANLVKPDKDLEDNEQLLQFEIQDM